MEGELGDMDGGTGVTWGEHGGELEGMDGEMEGTWRDNNGGNRDGASGTLMGVTGRDTCGEQRRDIWRDTGGYMQGDGGNWRDRR